ncbi:hypothetical protein LSAT2_031282 [Lamellibrachia satsuma]|nr:hypothetical protein LSAT2_031282 [Lamellibrachia satsuma]
MAVGTKKKTKMYLGKIATVEGKLKDRVKVQFSDGEMGCAKMNELEVEMEQLRQLVVAVVGREEVGCASGSGAGTVDYKVGEDVERDARESSP